MTSRAFKPEELNAEQAAVVNAPPEGVLLVRALAGSGKTRCLRYRVPFVLAQRNKEGRENSKVLVLAFNRLVAQEIREYFDKTLSEADQKRVVVRTCHGMATYMLHRFKKYTDIKSEELDIPKTYHLIDSAIAYIRDTKRVDFKDGAIKMLLGLDAEAFARGKPLREVAAEDANVLKSLNMTPVQVETWVEYLRAWRIRTGALTHDDTLPLANELPSDCFRALGFVDVLADELQDLNYQQRKFIRNFMEHARSFTGVGDQNQAIFGFAGADAQIFEHMLKDYPQAKVLTLSTNYRSSEPVLALANRVLELDVGTDLRLCGRGADGPNPRFYDKGVASVVEWLTELRMQGEPWNNIAILYRTRADSAILEARLAEAGVPFVLRDNSFFQEPIVQDIIAYLNVLYNPNVRIGDWRRIFNHFRGIGYNAANEIWEATDGRPRTWDFRNKPMAVRGPAGKQAWDNLSRRLENCFGFENQPKVLVKMLLGGLSIYWQQTYTDGGKKALQDRLKLATAFHTWVQDFPDIASGWDIVKTVLETEQGIEKNKVNLNAVELSTAHKYKGLERNSVGLWNIGDGSFPLYGDGIDVEEEKRLLYVACTRAKTNLAAFAQHEVSRGSTLGKHFAHPATTPQVDPVL